MILVTWDEIQELCSYKTHNNVLKRRVKTSQSAGLVKQTRWNVANFRHLNCIIRENIHTEDLL